VRGGDLDLVAGERRDTLGPEVHVESAVDSQNRSSAIRSMTGSLSTPPSWLVRKTYAQRPGSTVVMSRGVSSCMNASASGPAISTHFCTPTSHSDARSSTFQYSLTGES
jgi:hypothetical protein